jgi:steroid delta-isomerase-like uncharacterized protein
MRETGMPDDSPPVSGPIQRADLRALARRWFDQVWNEKNADTIEEMVAPACVIHGLSEEGLVLRGPAQFRRFYEPFRAAFPDIHIVVEDVLVEGSQTAVRIRGTGTHTGDGLGIRPTGRRVNVTGIIWIRWDDSGRIAEGWNEFDAAGLLRQLTAPAAPAVAVKAR